MIFTNQIASVLVGADKKKWGCWSGIVIFVSVMIIVLQLIPGPSAFDDAYITYRYSRNIAAGKGFTYNPGEKILGTTTPLFTILLALLNLLTSSQDFPTLALVLNSAADIVSVIFLIKLIHGIDFPKGIATAIGLTYLVNPLRIAISRGGMETSLVVLLILATAYTYIIQENNERAAVLAGITFLARPDTILLPIVIAGYDILRTRKLPIKEAVLFLITIGPWLVFSILYFGSMIPNSIAAKSNAYLIHSSHAVTSILGFIATRVPLRNLGWPLWLVGISLLLNLWFLIIGSVTAYKRSRRSLILTAYIAFYAAALSLANPLLFIWYFLPFSVVFSSLVIIGAYSLFQSIRPSVSVVATLTFVFSIILLEWTVFADSVDGISVSRRDHEALYEQAADAFSNEIESGTTLAMPEIGVLGYYFEDNRVLDTVGIVSPEAIKYLYDSPQPGQQRSYVIPIALILDLKPDYLLSLDVFFHPKLLDSGEFHEIYTLLDVIPTNAMGSSGFYVFKHIQN